MKLRRRSLGNIRFIGELYKIRMLTGKIMHECIKKLLIQTDEESLECLCTLVTNIGQVRQHSHLQFSMRKRNFIFMSNTSVISSHSYGVFVQLLDLETKSRMEKGVQGITSLDTYFAKMREIVTEKKTSSRVRFLMQDVIGKWSLEIRT